MTFFDKFSDFFKKKLQLAKGWKKPDPWSEWKTQHIVRQKIWKNEWLSPAPNWVNYNKNYKILNYSFLFIPWSIKLRLLIILLSRAFLTKMFPLISSTGVKTQSAAECPFCLKCSPTGVLLNSWQACVIVPWCWENLFTAVCPLSPPYWASLGAVLSHLRHVRMY